MAILTATGSSTSISLSIVGCAVVSFVALLRMPQPHAGADEDAEWLEASLAR